MLEHQSMEQPSKLHKVFRQVKKRVLLYLLGYVYLLVLNNKDAWNKEIGNVVNKYRDEFKNNALFAFSFKR